MKNKKFTFLSYTSIHFINNTLSRLYIYLLFLYLKQFKNKINSQISFQDTFNNITHFIGSILLYIIMFSLYSLKNMNMKYLLLMSIGNLLI